MMLFRLSFSLHALNLFGSDTRWLTHPSFAQLAVLAIAVIWVPFIIPLHDWIIVHELHLIRL